MRRALPLLQPALSTVGGAYSSILFSSKTWLGWALLAITFVRPVSAVGGLTAVITASLVATLLGYRGDAIRSGHYGFNALLLGLALTVGHGLDAATLLLCVLSGAAAALLTSFSADVMHRGLGLPVLVLPFVLLGGAAVSAFHTSPNAVPDVPLLSYDLGANGTGALILRSFAAIFFQPSLLAGALILVACLIASRIATLAAFGGICVAIATSRVLHPAGANVLVAAYNAALTAIAVGTFFFVPSRASLLAAAGSAALASWLSLAMEPLLAQLKLPVLAWPFVLVTFVCVRALRLKAPDRSPYTPPLPASSPEANLEHVATFKRRFGIPGPPQLCLPVTGAWNITQGAHGEHTHKSAWAGALDFEIMNVQGFPFRDEGRRNEDYFCFGAPVHAPGAGTIAAIQDGVPDGRPGEMDLLRPWGNAIVVQHGPELFSVVAHLKCGSVAVKPGQYVVPGQLLGACGSSGRSPRPHLHLQAQRTAELGAPAIPFRLLHYTIEESQVRQRYSFVGLPEEHDRIASVVANPLVDSFIALPPGREIVLSTDSGSDLRLCSEISLVGERSLVDVDSGDRLFFHAAFGCLTFTTYQGGPDGPLRALFLALPRVPSVTGAIVHFADEPPPRLLLPRPVQWMHELARALIDPVRTEARVVAHATADGVVFHTDVGIGLLKAEPRYRSRTELDGQGIVSIEVLDLKRPGTPLLQARRRV